MKLDLGEASEKQRLFYASRTLYTAYGGARGGGKSHAVRVKALLLALRYPGARILITRRAYPELQSGIIEPMLRMLPPKMRKYNASLRRLTLPNGSQIRFGHYGLGCRGEYQGQEYDWIFMDEATQFTYEEFRTLCACLRGASPLPRRFYLTCNPGGVGHAWVKRLFIDRDFITDPADPERSEDPADYSFIFATAEDNRAMMKNSPEYLKTLSALPENLRRAHRYGDWNALSGRFFAEFSREKHVAESFRLPEGWRLYRSIDYGLDMLACLWVAVDFSGRAWVVRELRRSGLIVSRAAEEILALTPPWERVEATFAPPDIWSRQKDGGISMAELFARAGVPLLRAPNNRVQGWMSLREYLRPGADGRPGLSIFSDCAGLIGDMEALQHDERNPSDAAREPHAVTHAPDALRYFCHARTLLPETPPAQEEEGGSYEDAMLGGEAETGYIGYWS